MGSEVWLAGFLGSIITLLLDKGLDLIKRKQEYSYSLKEKFFEKKLESAENAVRQWYITASSIGGLSSLYEQMSVEDELSGEVFEYMNDQLSANLTKLQEATNNIGSSFLLYFDVDHSNFWNTELFKDYNRVLSRIMEKVHQAQFWDEIIDRYEGTVHEGKFDHELEKIRDETRPLLKEFAGIMTKMQESIVALLNNVRKEMKQFEP